VELHVQDADVTYPASVVLYVHMSIQIKIVGGELIKEQIKDTSFRNYWLTWL
jgi:hypothetical protein